MDGLYTFVRNNSLSRDKLNYESGSVKNIHYGDIHTKFSVLFDVTKEHVPYVNSTEEIPDAESGDYCVEGDLIFADASEDTKDVGKSMEIVRLAGERLLSGQHTILARRKDDTLVVGFGGYLFRSGLIRSRIEKEAQGTKVYQISSTRLGGIEITFPRVKAEQQKIADCLMSLDEVIAAQGRKVEALKTHKRGLMQQLFPREGDTRPRLRFPEFRNAPEWEARLLADFISERSEIADGTVPLFSLTIEDGVTAKTERYERSFLVTSKEGAYKRVLPNEFAFNPMNLRFGAIGRHCGTQPVAVSKYYNIFSCNDSVDSRFCEKYFRSERMVALYDVIATGSLIEKRRVHFDRFLKLKIPFPVRHEQLRIADCLTSLDTQITAEANQLAALKSHKQGLMQQLFPAPEAVGA